MSAHQLKLNPSKTELLVIPGDSSLGQDLQITLHDSLLSPLATARNLGVTMDNELVFFPHMSLMLLVLVDFFSITSEGFDHFCPYRLPRCLFSLLSFQD
ncbi:hypothetical protein C0J45_1093, partial [Silurus meridionalis]